MDETRCYNCERDYDQCTDCAKIDLDVRDYERDHAVCENSNGKVLAKICNLKAVSTKVDSCSACGYQYIYP